MTVAEHAANTARVFLAAEIAMTSVNCGVPIVNRTRAEKLLDLYFALVEQAVPCTEINPLDRRSWSEHHTNNREVPLWLKPGPLVSGVSLLPPGFDMPPHWL